MLPTLFRHIFDPKTDHCVQEMVPSINTQPVLEELLPLQSVSNFWQPGKDLILRSLQHPQEVLQHHQELAVVEVASAFWALAEESHLMHLQTDKHRKFYLNVFKLTRDFPKFLIASIARDP